MKNVPLLLGMLLILCFSCGRDCEDIKVGDVRLIDGSAAYAPYEDGQSLSFSNSAGEMLVFAVEKLETTGKICTKYLCSNSSSPFQNVPCEYVGSTNIRNVLRSGDSLIIDINLVIENYQEESMLFYDLVSVNFSGVGALASASHVTNVHFNDPVFDQSTIFREPYFEFKNEYLIAGQSFNDVLVSAEGSNQLIYKDGEGLVAIKYQDNYYF